MTLEVHVCDFACLVQVPTSATRTSTSCEVYRALSAPPPSLYSTFRCPCLPRCTLRATRGFLRAAGPVAEPGRGLLRIKV